MPCCEKCGNTKPAFTTVYGEHRCELCWDDYLMTDRGKVEYLLGIYYGDYAPDDFDADFLGHVAVCWKKYRDEFTNLSMKDIKLIETVAENLGLL